MIGLSGGGSLVRPRSILDWTVVPDMSVCSIIVYELIQFLTPPPVSMKVRKYTTKLQYGESVFNVREQQKVLVSSTVYESRG